MRYCGVTCLPAKIILPIHAYLANTKTATPAAGTTAKRCNMQSIHDAPSRIRQGVRTRFPACLQPKVHQNLPTLRCDAAWISIASFDRNIVTNRNLPFAAWVVGIGIVASPELAGFEIVC